MTAARVSPTTFSTWRSLPSSDLLAPQPLRRKVRASAQRLELFPDYRRCDPFAAREGSKAAIGRRDHALAVADCRHRLLDAARDHFGVLYDIARRLDHTRDQHLVLRQRMLLERCIFVLVARIGE